MSRKTAIEKIKQFHPGVSSIKFGAGFVFVVITGGAKNKVYSYSGDSLSLLGR